MNREIEPIPSLEEDIDAIIDGLTEQQRKSKQVLQDFIKDHPILKQQEKFRRMEEALKMIEGITCNTDNADEMEIIELCFNISHKALKED